MNKIRCLVVDDEPLAVEVLSNYIGQLDNLSLAGTCANAIEALQFLQKHRVDLMFLDIQMPKLSGIEFLKTLPHRPKVIFTTAYRDYALEGFELNVLDYLLKPIPFERFLVSVNKFHAQQEPVALLPSMIMSQSLSADTFIYLKADKKMIKVFEKDILFIESLKDYVKVKTTEKEIITYQRITYLEEKLPEGRFLRIHRSFIIAVDKIRSFSSTTVEVGETELPIGRQYRAEVMRALGVDP